MQIKHESGIIEGSVSDDAVATIRATPEMFSMLSKLYSDPILALIREIYSNAIDSHVQAGKTSVSPEVKLPDRSDPTFYIRDFGVGLSNNAIKKLYLSYGYSTKNNDDDQIGGFGVGSKSPFAYKDSFNVESFYNGTHYTYMVYFNAKRIPALSLVNESKTTEPNGLKISVAANLGDVTKFHDSAKKLFTHVAIKPSLIGGDIKYEPTPMLIEDPNFKILENEYGQSLVIMGGVPYNTNIKVYDHPVWLTVKIGDVSVTPSREEIQMDAETVKFLENKVKEIEPKVLGYIETVVAAAPNYWEACKVYAKMRNFVKYQIQGKAPKYKGKDLKTSFRFEKDKVEFKSYYLTYRGKLQENSSGSLDVNSNIDPMSYYIEDTYNKQRLKHHITQQKNVANNGSYGGNVYFYAIKFANDVTKQEFEAETEIDTSLLKKMSDLPKAPRNPNSTNYKGQLKRYVNKPYVGGRAVWDTYVDNGEDTYYVLIEDRQLETMSGQVFDFCKDYIEKFETGTVILGVPKSSRAKLLKELEVDGVESLEVVFNRFKDKITNDTSIADIANAMAFFNDYTNLEDKNFIEFLKLTASSNQLITETRDKAKIWMSKNKYAEVLHEYVDLFGVKSKQVYTDQIDKIKKELPIVYWLFLAYNKTKDKEILELINKTI